MQVQSGDLSLEVEEFPGDGPPIVLVMGLGAQMLLWPDRFCAQLAEAGHHVVRFDNRDSGQSTRLHHLGVPNIPAGVVKARIGLPVRAPYALSDMAADALAVADAFGMARPCFVGASMGGMIVQRLAIEHPQRLAAFVSIMSAPGPARPHYSALRALLARPAPGKQGYIENFVTSFHAIGSKTHPMPADELQALAARCWDRGINPEGFARQLAAILAEPSRSEALRRCKVPALVVHGAQDPLIPLSYGIRTAHLLRCRLEVHAEMGHGLTPVVWDSMIASISRHATEHAAR